MSEGGQRNDVCFHCGRNEHEVTKMIRLANMDLVCDVCVAMMVEALNGPAPGKQNAAAEAASLNTKTPKEIVAFLDEYVIGQEDAKQTLAIAVYSHYKRLSHQCDVEIAKSNILLLGPTGTGKTLLAASIARMLDVPFCQADATSLTQAGYVGDDVETILQRLIQAADGDIGKAERGIVFIDEIDKIAAAKTGASITRDVSGEGVQQALLKILEGAKVSVPMTGNRKHAGTANQMIDTTHILFICAGAFVPLLEKVGRKAKAKRAIGFAAEEAPVKEVTKEVTPEHLFEFGMIPEFVGRLPVISVLDPLDCAAHERILVEPKNAVVKQMQARFAMEGAELVFEPGALKAVAQQAMELKTGARGARGILEKLLKPALYSVPGSSGAVVTVAKDLSVGIAYEHALAA